MATDFTRVLVKPKYLDVLYQRGMNKGVLAQKPFLFKPTGFVSNIEGLKPKNISQAKQLQWLEDFLDDPFRPITYCVSSMPHDGQAKLFAAFLMQETYRRITSGKSLPYWHDLTADFGNPLLKKEISVSMLVLNNVGVNSTPAKIEKLRDLLEAYADKPRIVISTGCDPFMFFTKHLYLSINACAYMTGMLVKKSVEM